MIRLTPLACMLLAACGGGGDVSQGERQSALREARAGMNAVRGLPGGKQATFSEVRLFGGETVCGKLDGNDGFGPRDFAVKDGVVTVTDPHEPANGATIAAACTGPSREITSRNPQFSDIDLAE